MEDIYERKFLRKHTQQFIESLNSQLECEILEEVALKEAIRALSEKGEILRRIDEKIQSELIGKSLLHDIEESGKINIEITKMMSKIYRFYETGTLTSHEHITFLGNPNEWNEFWKFFKGEIHKIKNDKNCHF